MQQLIMTRAFNNELKGKYKEYGNNYVQNQMMELQNQRKLGLLGSKDVNGRRRRWPADADSRCDRMAQETGYEYEFQHSRNQQYI